MAGQFLFLMDWHKGVKPDWKMFLLDCSGYSPPAGANKGGGGFSISWGLQIRAVILQ